MPALSVCEDLDSLVVQYMRLVDEHLNVHDRISTKFQEGRELISQAKYIMGPKNVSADCYDNRMKAIRGVAMDTPTEITIRDLAAERKRLAKEEENEQKKKELQEAMSKRDDGEISSRSDEIPSSSEGLRRRGGGMTMSRSENSPSPIQTSIDEAKSQAESDTPTPAPKKKKERKPDPLLWFGVFVPGSLRNAQAVFQNSLPDIVELTVIRQRLLQLEQDIERLQVLKKQTA
ncbi:hypothetical protein MVEG_02236 [Podila verticillata NRRL 6337]|nr:hypothetical protein MVEG_02236 [Podila verticillata NRRL 6337]